MADKFENVMPDYKDKKEFLIEPNDAKFLVVILRAKGDYNNSINTDKTCRLQLNLMQLIIKKALILNTTHSLCIQAKLLLRRSCITNHYNGKKLFWVILLKYICWTFYYSKNVYKNQL